MSLHKAQQPELDCTESCSLEKHADVILATTALGNVRLLHHCASLCGNPFHITDKFGRTPLHVAASLGLQPMVEWLLQRRAVGGGAGVNTADRESRWTALHRSLFYGHLGVAVRLLKHGALLDMKDFDGATPLSILNGNKSYFKPNLPVSSVSVSTWGSNANVTLGHDHTRRHPERLDLPTTTTITQAVVCKYHSVFLTAGGRVLTCGHGRGGRLGHGTEQSVVQLCEVKALSNCHCVAIAAARDHTVILTKTGVVYTCGLNDAHQLGLGSNPTNAPEFCLEPKPVVLRGARARQAVVGVGAGRYHTALCTGTEVLTAGRNLGQLGYEANYETQITPRAVVGIVVDADDQIVHLSASDAATACITRRQRIFVCTHFTVKSIRCSFLEKLSCEQFCVCASLNDMDHLRKISTEPKRVLLLDSEHKVWCWEPATKGAVPSLLPGLAAHRVANVSLGKCLTIVTCDGEAYSGPLTSSKPLLLSRLPMLQSAHAVFTDFKANNFVCLQNMYRSPQLPRVGDSELSSHLASLLEEGMLDPTLSDIEIKCGGAVFPGNRCVLSSLSAAMSSLLEDHPPSTPHPSTPLSIATWSSEPSQLLLHCSSPAVAEAFLHYAYGVPVRLCLPRAVNGAVADVSVELTPDTSIASIDENDLTAEYDRYSIPNFTQEFEDLDNKVLFSVGQSTPIKGTRDSDTAGSSSSIKDVHFPDRRSDLRSLLELAELFQVPSLKKQLQSVLSSNLQQQHILLSPPHKVRLKCTPQFSDLVLASDEGMTIYCHKCILVVRSEYFRSMLMMGWRETSNEAQTLKFPIKYPLLKAVIDYIYTDVCPSLEVAEPCTLDWVTSVLAVADQLLLTRLKELCEHELAKMLDFRNIAEVLEFAEAYSAQQLKQSCLQFISCNASALLEGKFLDGLDVSLLSDLSSVYREMVPAVSKRKIVFKEPDVAALPQSYFLEDIDTDQCDLFSEATASLEGPVRTQESESDGSLLQSTPRSGSRKKRKRRSSHSKTFSPPVSPEPVFEEPTANSPGTDVPTSPNLEANTDCSHSPNVCAAPRTEKNIAQKSSAEVSGADIRTTSQTKASSRSGWENLPSRQSTDDLRVIMAQEEREHQRKLSLESLHYKPKKLFAEGASSSPMDHPRLKHAPITVPQSTEDEASHLEHRTVSPLSRSNPWRREGVSQSPPPVSLRELMAEAEASEKKQRRPVEVRQEVQSDRKPVIERATLPPVIHRQVSFSEVMKAQKVEQDGHRRSSVGSSKHLSFIQIEERARLELERLYAVSDNPDEFITVEQFRPSQKVF